MHILVYKFRPKRTGFNMYARVYATAINCPFITFIRPTAIVDYNSLFKDKDKPLSMLTLFLLDLIIIMVIFIT